MNKNLQDPKVDGNNSVNVGKCFWYVIWMHQWVEAAGRRWHIA